VSAFFDERQLQGSLEQLTPQIRNYLKGQARAAQLAAFMAILENQYDVERHLEPMRVEVATDGFPSKGPEDAPVTIVEFSDFQCPYCLMFHNTLQQMQEKYGDQVRLVYRQFPLSSIHPQANDAAQASLCADEQGKFWDLHDAMFANQRALGRDQLKETARTLNLNGPVFDECLESGKYADAVAADVRAGQAVGVQGTPASFINGRFVSGAKPLEDLSAIIDEELARGGRQETAFLPGLPVHPPTGARSLGHTAARPSISARCAPATPVVSPLQREYRSPAILSP
jgi:protein-disulfide isomerase